MSEIANARINSFAPCAEQANVPPSYEPVFILTSSQLSNLITQAVEKAIQPLKDEIAQLREEHDRDREEIAALRRSVASLEQSHDTLSTNQLIQLRLFNGLKEEIHEEAEPSQGVLERVAKIEKLCTDAPGHTISLPELKGRLGIDKAVLSRLLKKIDRDKFYLRKSTLDKRVRYLCLRPEVR